MTNQDNTIVFNNKNVKTGKPLKASYLESLLKQASRHIFTEKSLLDLQEQARYLRQQQIQARDSRAINFILESLKNKRLIAKLSRKNKLSILKAIDYKELYSQAVIEQDTDKIDNLITSLKNENTLLKMTAEQRASIKELLDPNIFIK